MTPFTSVTSLVIPMLVDNIDTDTIIPSREMRSTGRTGLADGLFAPWRYREARAPNPQFVLNQPEFADATILAGGSNFGCGSSREHAVWAMAEYGLRAVIAESFAPIFAANCVRNGMLPVQLPHAVVESLAGKTATIDLETQTVSSGEECWSFPISADDRAMLLGGIDAIDLTLMSRGAIDRWIEQDRDERPWVYLKARA